MGHNITYTSLPSHLTRDEVTSRVFYAVARNGDAGTSRIEFYSDKIFDSYDEAKEFIVKVDHGYYGGYAVKYRDYNKMTPNAAVVALQKKASDTLKKKDAFATEHSVQNMKPAFIGCPNCGSKLNRSRIRGQVCPLCLVDLRSQSTLTRLRGFDEKYRELQDKILEEQKRQKDKAEIRWLVKYEYHV